MKKILWAVFLLSFSGCSLSMTKNPDMPGFAFYQSSSKGNIQKAVSPEGIVFQISQRNNYPEKADKDFWTEAVRSYLPQKGYKIMREGGTQRGRYFIFLVPGTKYDYFYFVHFYIENQKIILTESGGQYALLKDYEDKLIAFVAKN